MRRVPEKRAREPASSAVRRRTTTMKRTRESPTGVDTMSLQDTSRRAAMGTMMTRALRMARRNQVTARTTITRRSRDESSDHKNNLLGCAEWLNTAS
ncbi:hypothetical protein M758_UG156700 [Ceratodon purpureus]|nr:hypothetical protein M758_UG156700 [Ceratodon purpureus]